MSGLKPLVGIDVGSSSACVVVAEPSDEGPVVAGCGQAPHEGAKKGIIANLESVVEAVRLAAEEAEAMSSLPVERGVVGIGGTQIQGMKAVGQARVTGKSGTITPVDLKRALDRCADISIPPDYQVLDILATSWSVDGQPPLQTPPLGMVGQTLTATAYVLYTHRSHADTLTVAVNRAGVEVERLVYEPLAAATAVVTDDERDYGCLLIDIGSGSTEWSLFADGVVVATGSSPVAGRSFTSDLAILLKTSTISAERLKHRLGLAAALDHDEAEAIEVPSVGGQGVQVIPARFAAEILQERSRDLFVRIHQALVADGLERIPRTGVVLSGGGACLDGIAELAERIFGLPARLGTPRGLQGLSEPVSTADWAVAYGLVLTQHRGEDLFRPTTHGTSTGLLARIREALGEFLELGGGT